VTEPQIGGWYLPKGDTYFPKFCEGPAPKRNGFQREHLLAAFEYVRAWDVAIDVGAHVGFWARDMAQRFGKVYAFEPAEDCYECLNKNLADLVNVQAYKAAVGATAGSCTMQDDEKRLGNTGSRFVAPHCDGETPMVTLDELGFLACDFLKVDVEGYEHCVLVGASKLIRRHRPVIIMECDKHFSMKRYGVPDDSAEQWLLGKGYRVAEHIRPDKVFVPN
jgi:FkbM family methyltransferase